MTYSDGQEVKIGDKVKLWNDCYGVVVASIDAGEYSEACSKDDWEHLKAGVLIDSDKASLVHYLESDEDLKLVERAVE